MPITSKEKTMKTLLLALLLASGFAACTVTAPHSPDTHGFLLRVGEVRPTKKPGLFLVRGSDRRGNALGPSYRVHCAVKPSVGDCVKVCDDLKVQPRF